MLVHNFKTYDLFCDKFEINEFNYLFILTNVFILVHYLSILTNICLFPLFSRLNSHQMTSKTLVKWGVATMVLSTKCCMKKVLPLWL